MISADAPGRVNLIGEHTDYNGGFVLPIATPQRTIVDLVVRGDHRVVITSRNVPNDPRTEYLLGRERRCGRWSDYVQAVTDALARRRLVIGGFDATIRSDVPAGAGLGSSAALEVALIRAISAAFALDLDAVTIARIAHDAETGLVGAPVGIMDQMAASLADASTALFIDTRSLEFERLSIPPGTALIVIDSGLRHSHVGGEYRVRRAECDAAAAQLRVPLLRDVRAGAPAASALGSPLDRRVRHVVSENARVLQARDALLKSDPIAFGHLMNGSHASMRDDFEVSTPEIDALVALAQAEPNVYGARLTGGGFGGAIVALADATDARVVADRVASRYRTQIGRDTTVLIPS